VPAADLHAGEAVWRADGSYGTVESVAHTQRPQVMYHLTVDTAHTYFVGDGQWVVHNACIPGTYVGPGSTMTRGGHHIHAKQGFVSHPDYDPNAALVLRHPDMAAHSYRHGQMSTEQQRLFMQLSRDVNSGIKRNTMLEHTRIAVEALVAGGVPLSEARSYVAQSLLNLRRQGVRYPTNIPWDVSGSGTLRPGTFR
jgi:hypothetical protein